MSFFEKKYKDEIENWDWASIVEESKENCFIDEENNIIASVYLGSVFSIYPSGKYWTFFTTNATLKERLKDSRFDEALNSVADFYNGFIVRGEGDPTDVYFQMVIDLPESSELVEHDLQFITNDDWKKFEELVNEART